MRKFYVVLNAQWPNGQPTTFKATVEANDVEEVMCKYGPEVITYATKVEITEVK